MYDIKGGQACGIDTVGVLYGFGSREEFEEAGATYIVERPEDILRL
jgi:phosphoglycolate phosphatase